jgi:hypothetical protein
LFAAVVLAAAVAGRVVAAEGDVRFEEVGDVSQVDVFQLLSPIGFDYVEA